MTKKRTPVVEKALKQLKKKFTKIKNHTPKFYDEADSLQKKVYKEAWFNTGNNDTRYISMGYFILALYQSIGDYKIISDNLMDKVLTSYQYAKNGGHDEYEMEKESGILANEVLRLLDGDKEVITPFKRRMTILRQNRILEQGYN